MIIILYYFHKKIIIPWTLFSSGVIVAHLIPTLYFLMASAASTVTINNNLKKISVNVLKSVKKIIPKKCAL